MSSGKRETGAKGNEGRGTVGAIAFRAGYADAAAGAAVAVPAGGGSASAGGSILPLFLFGFPCVVFGAEDQRADGEGSDRRRGEQLPEREPDASVGRNREERFLVVLSAVDGNGALVFAFDLTGEQIFHFDVPFCVGRAFSAGTDRLSGGGQSVTDR